MRTTLNIEESLLARASKLVGIHEKTALVRMGLEALIEPKIYNRIWNSTQNFFILPSKKVLKYSKVFSNFFMRKYFELFRLGSQTYCKIRVEKESSKRLSALGGTEKKLKNIPRK